jgi:hypothetical protein
MLYFFQVKRTTDSLKAEIALEAAPYAAARKMFQRDVSASDMAFHRGTAYVNTTEAVFDHSHKLHQAIVGVSWLTFTCVVASVGLTIAGLCNIFLS